MQVTIKLLSMQKLIEMKKNRLILIIFLAVISLLGFMVFKYFSRNQSSVSINPQSIRKHVIEDLNGDGANELIEIVLNKNKDDCCAMDYQLSIYKEQSRNNKGIYYSLLASTQNIQGGSQETSIEVFSFSGQKLLLVDGLYQGVNSNFAIFYRFNQDGQNILPICRSGNELNEIEGCGNKTSFFFSDAGGIAVDDLEKDNNLEIIEFLRIYPYTIDEKISAQSYIGSISRYDSNTQMFQQVPKSELERLSKAIISNSQQEEVISLKDYKTYVGVQE